METSELLKKVRRIEIKTRGLSRNIFAGQYHSAFKGRGMAFSEVREYQYGDDIRDIDWNVTARYVRPYVKVFEEERELTVMLLIDVSGSRDFGSVNVMKKEVITEIAATLAFSAIQNNDKIGVVFFSDKIEKFIPPQKGKKHILYIIRELIDFHPEETRTDISQVLKYLTNAIKKRCTAFLISDFIDKEGFKDALTVANRKHDMVAIQVYDRRETELPAVGLMKIKDAETGKEQWIDSSSARVRAAYKEWWEKRQAKMSDTFKKCRVDSVSVRTEDDYVKALIALFDKRNKSKQMKLIKKSILFLVAAASLVGGRAYAQRPLIDVAIDSAAILIGEQTTLHLTVTADKDRPVQIVIPNDTLMTGVEVLNLSKADSTEIENDRLVIKQDVLITSFDSSLYLLPPLKVIDGVDTVYSNQVALKVSTIPVNADKPEEFNDIKTVWKPPFVWADYYPIIYGILLALFLICVIAYIVKRIRAKKSLIPFKKEEPKLPPHEQAIKELDEIKQQKLWQQGRSKEYYTLITDTLRKYIEERFGINAMEMTSGEILDLIRKNSEAQSVYENLRQILQLADFVKFAKMNPLPDENDLSMMNAYLFVNQTKEEEMVELVDSPLSDELTASGQEERQPAVKAVDSPLSNEPVAPCQDDLTRYQPKSTNDTTNLKD